MDRYPVILYIGAGVLGKIGGELIVTDPAIQRLLTPSELAMQAFVLFSTIAVLVTGRYLQSLKPKETPY
jgi:predicted tellurium resistance membrane protein TerC